MKVEIVVRKVRMMITSAAAAAIVMMRMRLAGMVRIMMRKV